MSLRAISSKLAKRSIVTSILPRTSITCGVRYMSTPSTNPPEPKIKAQSIIDAMPGSTILSKTGILGTSAAAAIYAISNELYVINEESILFVTFLAVLGILGKFVAPFYSDWADARLEKVSGILNASRERHVSAVKQRIDSVSQLQNVSQTTKVLFDVSKETVQLEAKAFELKQKVELARHAKSVLDSWVRYESSLRKLQQEKIAESVISKVQAELGNPKFQEKLLQQSITDVEKLFASLR